MSVTEDYISFEIAKLLKEKGYKGSFNGYYNNAGCVVDKPNTLLNEPKYQYYERVSLYMAMKWLREVCNIEINVSMSALNSDNSREYMFNIFFTNERYLEPSKTKTGFKCYEEAAETAIKYCLTNII